MIERTDGSVKTKGVMSEMGDGPVPLDGGGCDLILIKTTLAGTGPGTGTDDAVATDRCRR